MIAKATDPKWAQQFARIEWSVEGKGERERERVCVCVCVCVCGVRE